MIALVLIALSHIRSNVAVGTVDRAMELLPPASPIKNRLQVEAAQGVFWFDARSLRSWQSQSPSSDIPCFEEVVDG